MKSLLIIFIGAILVLFTGLGKKENRSSILAMGILLLALVFAVLDFGGWAKWDFELKYVPQEMMFFNRISLAFVVILIMAAIFILGLFRQKETVGSDLIGLLMFSLCGGIIMTAFNHLVMLFIGMEALSIPLYVLAASKKSSLKSNEAAIKYFLMGAFSSAVFLLGCAFVYGATGGLDMVSLYFAAEKLVHMGAVSSLLTIGVSLIMIGLCFKVSAVPFHFWSPDVYEGSPNRATVFMSTVVKIAAFAAFSAYYLWFCLN
jgi:NADH-quinone oxidoreductase subunit N